MAESPVMWFDEIGMADVPLVGGKNASLGEMIRTLQSEGVRVPDGFATTAAAYRSFVAANGHRRRHAIAHRRLPGRRRHAARHRRGHPATCSWPASPRRHRRRHPRRLPEPRARRAGGPARRRRAQQRDRRGPAGRELRRPAGDLPQRRGRAGAAGRLPPLLRLALHRPGDQLPRRTRASTTWRSPSRSASSGWCAPTRRLRGDVLDRHRDRLPRRRASSTRPGAWARPSSRARSNPDEYLVFKPLLTSRGAELAPILEKTLGAKALKMVYGRGGERPHRRWWTPPEAERRAFVLSDDEILRPGPLGLHDRGPLRPARWTWNGPRTARPANCSSSRPGPRRCSRAADRPRFTIHRLQDEGPDAGHRPARRRLRSRRGTACVDPDAARHRRRSATARSSSTEMTDPDWVPIMKRAAGIVTDHGGRTCHAAIVSRELGVPAVVGTGDATPCSRRPGRDGLLRRGRAGFVYDGTAGVRSRRPGPRRAAATAHQGHAQRRQPRGGLPLVAAAARRRRPGPDGVHRQQPDQGPPDGAGRTPNASRTGEARRQIDGADARLCATRPSTSSTRWPRASPRSPRLLPAGR